MKKLYNVVALAFCLLLSIQTQASHIMGADITYSYIGTTASGQQRYFVRLSFYRDCCSGCLVAGPSNFLTVTDSCTGTVLNYTMNSDSCPNGCEVVTLCPGQQSTCDILTSLYPGVEKYVDTVTITLPAACSKWTVSWTDGSRNATISNLQNPSSQSIYIQATINNSINPATGTQYTNSSVYFTKNPVPFACLNNASSITYSNGAVDPNGDSLVYTLINPLTAANTPIPHSGTYTSTQPISSNPPVTFNPLTGILGYKPTQTEVDVITFLVQEYRNGVLIGSVMRDVQLTIIGGCTLPPPPVAGDPINLINADTLGTTVKVCPSTMSSFDIVFKDPNGRNVTLTSDITGTPSALPGATFTQLGTGDSVIAHITWNPLASDTGCHPFEINVSTDDCPIPGTSVKSYQVCVLTKVTVTPHNIIYCGTPIRLTATGGSNATWTPTAGLTFPGSIYNPLAAPTATTLYTFTSDCGSDTALIIYNPPFRMSAGPGGTICQNNFLQLNAGLDSLYAPYDILWIPATGLTNPLTNTPDDSILNPIASPLQTTTYTLQVTANTGCIRTDTVTVTVHGQAPAINAHARPDTVCPGQPVQLWVTDNPVCGAATTPCQGSATIIQVGTATTVQGGTAFAYPAPYGNYYKSARHQFLFQASELRTLLGSGGTIESVAMNVGVLNSGSILNNFTIRMGCVPDDSLTGYVNEALLTTVYVANYTPIQGWNTHALQTPYNWDGQSNLVIDMCFIDQTNNNINPKMQYSATPFSSVWYTTTNSPAGACGFSGNPAAMSTANYQRPNFKFNFCRPPLSPISWTPSTGPNGVTLPNADTTYSNPVNQTTYYVTLADTNGCSSRDFVTVFVDTGVQFHVVPDTFICSSSPVQLHANAVIAAGSGVNPANIVYTWTTRPAATVPPSGTGPGFSSPTVTATATTTYICTITGPGICAITDSATVTLGTGLPVNKIVDSISCAGGNNGKVIINMNAGTAPYQYTWSPAAANADSIVNLGPGTYYMTVTDAGGCIGHDTTTLIAPSPLTLTFNSTNILCYQNNTGTITALAGGGRQPYRYTWSPAAANTSSLTGLSANTYNLTVTDTSGCTISGSVNITQPTQLTSIATTTSLSAAGAHDGTITVITSGGTPGYTYNSVPAVTGLPNATGLDTGIYYITVCDLNHCCVIDTAHISGPPPINIYFTTVNNLCHDSCDGTATASASGGVPPYTYNWTAVPPGPSLGTGLTISHLCAGAYRITVVDSNHISVSKDTVITAPPAIGMHIDSTNITCFGANDGTLHDSVWGGVGPYTVIWTPGGGDPLSGLSPGSYSVQVYDANQCPATDSATISQPTPVTAAIISTDSVTCFGLANGFANIQSGGGRPPYHYTWSGSNSVDSFANNLVAGAQSVTVTDASGCTASATFTIYQPTQIVISSIDTTSAHCATSHDGSAIATVSGGSPGYTYSWDGNAGSNTITGLIPGNHNLIVTDSKGCTQSSPFVINTQYILALTMGSDSVSCNGGSDGIAFTTVINGSPNYTYSWSPASSTSDSATGLAASTQTVIATDLYGCTATGTVTVGQPNPITDAAFFSNPLCASQQNGKVWITAGGTVGPYTFTFNGSAGVHPITDTIFNLGAATYSFTVTDGKGCTKTDAVTLSDPSQLSLPTPVTTSISCANDANGSVQVSPTGGTQPYTYAWSPGGYSAAYEDSLGPNTYNITVTDANGCNVSVSVTLSAPPPISLLYLESDSTSCPDSADGHIVVDPTGGTPYNVNEPYTYSIDGINYQNNHNFYDLAAGVYHLYVKDSMGCVFDTTVNVYQPFPVTASINPQDSVIALGSSIQLFTVINNTTTQSINSYSWSPSDGLNCIDCPNPVSSPFHTTTYYLTINYGKNCTTTASDRVQVGPGPETYIPNAFTPNGDGVNDDFEVFGTTLQSVGMKIFNRWGEKVFDSGDSEWASWDGTYKGVSQPTGVYVYYVELVYLDGKKKYREGSVTLIR